MHLIELKQLIISKLVAIGVVRYGSFTLKSGIISPIYLDFRRLVSYPSILKLLVKLAILTHPQLFTTKTIFMGLPIGGLPLAFALSLECDIPQVLLRKERKDYGLCNILEGEWSLSSSKSSFLFIDDVITTGSSIIETIKLLADNNITNNEDKLSSNNLLVICSRNDDLNIEGINIHSMLKLDDFINYSSSTITPFGEHAVMSNVLYRLALLKQSNIILACDLSNFDEIESIVRQLGDYIVAIKLHADIIHDFNDDMIDRLIMLKTAYNILIIEDRKLADIGIIELRQLTTPSLNIKSWADAVTIHGFAGISDKLCDEGIPLLVIAEMSNNDNLIDEGYTRLIYNLVKQERFNKYCMGFICQDKIPKLMDSVYEYVTLSPGINLDVSGDKCNQSYYNPISEGGSKRGLFWIVGRGIIKESNDALVKKMMEYKTCGWNYFINY
jgi:uridine monophosphate synthetase